jgi:hypothetical protein
MPNLEEAIRERAYLLWLNDGRPEGQADIYWLNAQRDLLTTSVEAIVAPTKTAAAKTEVAKPARKPRLPSFRKSKAKEA